MGAILASLSRREISERYYRAYRIPRRAWCLCNLQHHQNPHARLPLGTESKPHILGAKDAMAKIYIICYLWKPISLPSATLIRNRFHTAPSASHFSLADSSDYIWLSGQRDLLNIRRQSEVELSIVGMKLTDLTGNRGYMYSLLGTIKSYFCSCIHRKHMHLLIPAPEI